MFTDEYIPTTACHCSGEKANYKKSKKKARQQHDDRFGKDSEIKELLIIGAGPHAFTLLLRLLEPDADLLSDKDRHTKAEFRSRMRPISHVYSHINKLAQGPSTVLKCTKKNKNNKKKINNDDTKAPPVNPPPLSLEQVRKSVVVVDSNGNNWLTNWKENFDALHIKNLRSLMNAHADPYDHRTLEYYAEGRGRGAELVSLPNLSQKDKDFRGPYQVPSAVLFNDFHSLLARGYGIHDIVRKGNVTSIDPVGAQYDANQVEEPIFHVTIDFADLDSPIIIKTRRVVCAMGPCFKTGEAFWEASLRKELVRVGKTYPSDRILHPFDIVPYLKSRNKQQQQQQIQHQVDIKPPLRRLLIVGGGITSAQLAIVAANAPWCQTVHLIQRSQIILRHFDVENKWMGPRRGQLLDDFWLLDYPERAQLLRHARRGGSIPPETLKELLDCCKKPNIDLKVQEEIQISEVYLNDDQRFHVTLDGGFDSEEYDMVWLATGCENHIDYYEALSHLREKLPVQVICGLPVLNKCLSWRRCSTKEEPKWKDVLRRRLWCMGSLAGLELGPDALNLIGARHGAVRVARSIRHDMMKLNV